MKSRAILILLSFAYFPAPTVKAVTFDWAIVGNRNNVGDVQSQGTYGAVSYAYLISKYEVTNGQYTEFLNAVDPHGANTLALYNSQMSSSATGGIDLNTAGIDGSKYETKLGRDNNPVVYVSYFDAIRFVNWLENGQLDGDTESGVYTISDGLCEVRDAHANFFVPSEDEWYKAAYYDPNSRVYYEYPTGTNAGPYSDNPGSLNTPDNTNVVNAFGDDSFTNGYDDGYAVTGNTSYISDQNYLTDVGAYSLAASPYGTFDQGGNVYEWNEALIRSSFRGLRGGSWELGTHLMRANIRRSIYPSFEVANVGFRVAALPEPNGVSLVGWAIAGLSVFMSHYRYP